MECPKKFAFLVVLFFLCVTAEAAVIVSQPSIPKILAKYGLPVGLLPDCVSSYSLSDDGDFQVEIDNPCEINFKYLVSYETVIQGKLTYGKITQLSGILAKKFLLWMHVTGIEVDIPNSGYIYFHVGAISKKLDIALFQSLHKCKDSLEEQDKKESQPALAEVVLDNPCEINFKYLVSHETVIQGKLTYGKITQLSGIYAKKFLLWMHLTGIELDIPNSGYIYFHVGAISKMLYISLFLSVHECKDSLGEQDKKESQPSLAKRAVE